MLTNVKYCIQQLPTVDSINVNKFSQMLINTSKFLHLLVNVRIIFTSINESKDVNKYEEVFTNVNKC